MKQISTLIFLTLVFCCSWPPLARAVDSEPPFNNPVLQRHYEGLIQDFRCLVCFDENIANSNAKLAADFRRQVHDMVAAGKNDRQIKDFMIDRYGDFVLYRPPVQPDTWLLWGGPFLLLLIGLVLLVFILRRRAHMDSASEGSS